MSAAWIEAVSQGTALWAEAMTRACWQGSGVLALVWVIGRAGRRLSPTARCWLWRLASLKLIAALLWARPVDLPLRHVPAAGGWWGLAAPFPGWAALPAGGTALSQIPASAAPVSLAQMLFLLWLLGVAGYVARFAWQCGQTRRRLADCEPLRDEGLIAACGALCRSLGLRRAPCLLVAAGGGSPWLVGIRSPAIIFPASLLAACHESELRLMLAHELAHLRRCDLSWGWLGTAAQGLFFFHPLVWLAGGEWRLAQEMACDAIAMEITRAPAAEYGGVLLKVAAQRRPDFHGGPVTVAVIESYHTLRRRLIAMKSFGSVSPRRLGGAGIALAALGALALIPWRVVAQEPPGPRLTIVMKGGGATRADLLNLALRRDVQEHLQLSPAQKNAFAEVQKRLEDVERKQADEEMLARQDLEASARQGLPEEELKARMAERREPIQAVREFLIQHVATILGPAQLQRLRELSLQRQGPLALTDPRTADAVGLSPAHRAAIAQIAESLKQHQSEPIRVTSPAEGTLELKINEERARVAEAAGRILSVLDVGERARWHALQGAPFAFSPENEAQFKGAGYRVVIPASPERR